MSRRKRRARRFAPNPPRQEQSDSSASPSREMAEPTPDERSPDRGADEADAPSDARADDSSAYEHDEPDPADQASADQPDEPTEEDTDSAPPARPWEPAKADLLAAEPNADQPAPEPPSPEARPQPPEPASPDAQRPEPVRPAPPTRSDEAKPDLSVPSPHRPWGPQETAEPRAPVPPQESLAAADVPSSSRAATPSPPGAPEDPARPVTPVPPPSVTGRAVGAVDFAAAERLAAEEAYSFDEEPEALVEAAPLAPRTSTARLPEADVAAAVQAAVAALPGRSPIPGICPFLRSAAATGLAPPLDGVDLRHRCAALAEPLAVSRPQQELLCLQPSHVSCPRYARGLMTIQDRIAPRATNTRQMPIVAAAVLLIIIAAAAGTIAVLRGGLGVPVGAVGSPTPSASPSAATVTPTPTSSPSASPTPSPAATPTLRPTPSPTRLPAAYATLDPCPQSDPQSPCFLYVVAQGDSLSTIADRYRTTVEEIRRINPEISDPDAISEGDRIRIPPPPG